MGSVPGMVVGVGRRRCDLSMSDLAGRRSIGPLAWMDASLSGAANSPRHSTILLDDRGMLSLPENVR